MNDITDDLIVLSSSHQISCFCTVIPKTYIGSLNRFILIYFSIINYFYVITEDHYLSKLKSIIY